MANKIIEMLLKAKTSDATSGVDKLSKSMTSLKSSTLLTISNFTGLVKKLSELTDATDSYNTSVRLLKSTLGSSSDEASNFIHKLGQMSGISTAALNRQTAKFFQLGESLNFSNEQAEKFSENLSILSTKLALLYNTDYETMANSLQKAVQGSQVTLKSRTGIAINDVSLQATLNANAVDREVSSLNDAEKAIVRYATILRQVTSDTSTYQDAVNSLAWQKQMLSYQMKKLAAVTGQLVTPALTQLYIVMNAIIMVAIEIIKVLGSIFNINMDISAGVSATSDGFDNLGASIGRASNIAKKSLRGFDKLNNITTPSAGGGGGGGLLGIDNSILKLLDEVDDQFLEIQNKATEIKNQILKWLGINEDMSNAVDRVKEILEWAKMIGAVLLGWEVSKVVADIFAIIGKDFGLGKKIGLTLTIGSLIWAIDASNKLANGEVTNQSVLEAVGAAIGAGVGMGMLTGSVLFGLDIAILIGEFEMAAYGEGRSPDWVKFIFGHQDKMYEDSFLQKIGLDKGPSVAISLTAYLTIALDGILDNVPEFKKWLYDTLLWAIKEILWNVAEAIKNIPIIGYAIGSAIQQGIKLSEKDTKDTLVESTGRAIDKAKPEINLKSEETGKEATNNYMKGMKERFDKSKVELQQKIEDTIGDASTEADETFEENGTENATTYIEATMDTFDENQENVTNSIEDLMGTSTTNAEPSTTQNAIDLAKDFADNMGDTIYGANPEITNQLTKTVETSAANTDTSKSANVGENIASNVKLGIERSNLGNDLKDTGETIGQDFADSISDNMEVNNSTLGRSLNSAVSGALSRIKNNNWSLFGSGGFLSDLFNFRWTYFADGGFPTEGEMFIAREAGAEMVGSINGHTAVANNDQIVKGIQSGVFNAMMSALSSTDFGNSNVVIEANGDAEGLLDFIEFKQKQKSRQFN